jgi:acetolactate synthase-1/2/3 large subunit
MVRGLTKYAVLVDDPQSILYHLERAFRLAQTGRPGPCWLDIPVDVQGAQIDEAGARRYEPAEDEPKWDRDLIARQCDEVLARIKSAKHPVILAGTGVRLAHALDEFHDVAHRLRVPVTTAWTHDLIASDNELFCGRPGTIGERAGNFTVQNSDCLLILGSRLNIRQVSYNWQAFAPKAFKIQVDVDCAELQKPLVKPGLPIHCDLKVFLAELRSRLAGYKPAHERWLKWCRERVAKYPVVQPQQRAPGPPLNPYGFMERLNAMLAPDDVIACGNATACIVSFQVLRLTKDQRLFSNSGSASMGYDLPAAVGAAVARGGKRVICMAGDGSLQLNIQELATVAHNKLPVKIFVLNNGGYLSIRSTQANFFQKLVGESPESGVSFPDYQKAAAAYGIPSLRIDREAQYRDVERALALKGPVLIEVMLDPAQGFEPRIRSRQLPDGRIVSPALEDMYPFLEPAELAANMEPPE